MSNGEGVGNVRVLRDGMGGRLQKLGGVDWIFMGIRGSLSITFGSPSLELSINNTLVLIQNSSIKLSSLPPPCVSGSSRVVPV